jgi:hypothetical protein
MSTNPYAPPAAPVADIPQPAAPTVQAIYFPISILKLAVLTTCTLGLYELYWFYMNWRLIRDREGFKCNPALRSIFSVFFVYSLFARIRAGGEKLGAGAALLAGPLATGWIITTIAARLPPPYWLVTLINPVFLLPVQAYVNRVNEAAAPGHEPNARFSGWNWAAVVIGTLFLMLAIIGSFAPEP